VQIFGISQSGGLKEVKKQLGNSKLLFNLPKLG
jgi:hypothetical protein